MIELGRIRIKDWFTGGRCSSFFLLHFFFAHSSSMFVPEPTRTRAASSMSILCGSSASGLEYRLYGLWVYQVVAAEDPVARRRLPTICGEGSKSGLGTNATFPTLEALHQTWALERHSDDVTYGLGIVLLAHAIREHRHLAIHHLPARPRPRPKSTMPQVATDDVSWNPERSTGHSRTSPHLNFSGAAPSVVRLENRFSRRSLLPLSSHASRAPSRLSRTSSAASFVKRRMSLSEQQRLDADHLQLVLAAVPNCVNSSTFNLATKGEAILSHLERLERSTAAAPR